MFEDKTLVCKDCGKEFVWTAGEQEFYAERQMYDAVCASCGKACKVPFQPREDRPVYCSECFAKMRQN